MKSSQYIILTVSVLGILSHGFSPSASAQSSPDCIPPPTGLVSWWRAEGNAGDSEGRNHGVLRGTVGFAPGLVGKAFVFNYGWVEVADTTELNFGDGAPMTIELWAYRTGAHGTMHFIGKRTKCSGATHSDMNYQMGFNETWGEGMFFGAGDTEHQASNGAPMPRYTWIHVAGVFDGTNLLLYTNAVLAASQRSTLGSINTAPLLIGGSDGCEPFIGLIDEVSLYNRALSVDEVQAIYKAGSAGKCFTAMAPSIRVVQVELCWQSVTNTSYQVQYRSDLTANLWTPLVECIQGRAGTTCVQDTVLPGDAQRYYRVVPTNCVPALCNPSPE